MADYMMSKKTYRCDECGGRFTIEELQHSTQSSVPAFHGRTDELEALELTHARACQGRMQVVLVHGEPGIGKTALIRALYHGLVSTEHDPENFWPDVIGELSELSWENPKLTECRRGISAQGASTK